MRPFRVAPWLAAAHAQTIAGRLLRPHTPDIPLRRERIDTPDGDFLDLDHAPPPPDSRDPDEGPAPVVLLLHGLEGSARRGYAILTYKALAARGIRAVGMNFRGCSGEPNRTPRFYHSGETEDLRVVLRHLACRFPGAAIGAVAFSLGGNVLLKFLGEESEAGPAWLRSAVAISVPFDLAAGARQLEHSFGRVYASYFVRSLRAKVSAKAALLNGRVDLERVRRTRTFREFDEAVTAPLHGFADADDYYRRSSSGPLLERIRVPTLLLQSRDDPFLPREAVPHATIEGNPWLADGLTRTGGHVGFITGNRPWSPAFWAEAETARFLATRLRTA